VLARRAWRRGASAAGAGGAGASAGQAGSAGVAGVAGGASGSVGVGGNAEEGGNAGASGSVDVGGNAEEAGNAGTSGSVGTPGHLVLSAYGLNFAGECDLPVQHVIISNDGGSPFTWLANVHFVGTLQPVQVAPNTSTLLPGTSVTVEVSPSVPQVAGNIVSDIAITTDLADQPMALVALSYSVSGFGITPPPDIDFGEVPTSSMASGIIEAVQFYNVPGVVLTASGFLPGTTPLPQFSLHGAVPNDPSPGLWTLYFMPQVVGPASVTLTVGSMGHVVCPPNTFTANGVGVAP